MECATTTNIFFTRSTSKAEEKHHPFSDRTDSVRSISPSSSLCSSEPIDVQVSASDLRADEQCILRMQESMEYYNSCTWEMYYRITKARKERKNRRFPFGHQNKAEASSIQSNHKNGREEQRNQSTDSYKQQREQNIFHLEM